MMTPAERGAFALHVVGANAALEADARGAALRVVAHGYISDAALRALYARVKVAVAPLTSGAGVKGKVSQAMLLGVPVVATPVAAEGMALQDGVDALLASTPEDFAAQILAAHRDCALWARVAAAARSHAAARFGVGAAAREIARTLGRLGFAVPVPRDTVTCDQRA